MGGLIGSLVSTGTIAANNVVQIIDCDSNGNTYGAGSLGGVVGSADGGILNNGLNIDNVSVTGLVVGYTNQPTATEKIGGVAGQTSNGVNVSDCHVSATVHGQNRLGGVVGEAVDGLRVVGCDVTSTSIRGESFVGGVFGHAERDIWVSIHTGSASIEGVSRVGGVGGLATDDVFMGSVTQTGPVRASGDFVGGLIGLASDGVMLADNRSSGLVGPLFGAGSATSDYVGGLVGLAYTDISIENSIATGDVVGRDFVGGAVGSVNFMPGNIRNSSARVQRTLAVSDVTGRNYVGGLIGISYNATQLDTFTTGAVVGDDLVGGLVGDANESTGRNATITNSFSVSPVSQTPGTAASIQLGSLVGYSSGISYSGNWWVAGVSQRAALGVDAQSTNENPLGTDRRNSIAGLQLPTAAGDRPSVPYHGWDATWDFGTAAQLPGLRMAGTVYRDSRGVGRLD